MDTNSTNINRETGAIKDKIEIKVEELAIAIKEQSAGQLSSNIKSDDIRECENVTLSLEDELSYIR